MNRGRVRRLTARLGIIGRLFEYLWKERVWWMIPIIVVVLLCGLLILSSQSSAVAPFLYTLF